MPKKGQSNYDPGFVYVATSKTLGYNNTKIGLSRNPLTRADQLNEQAYGGVDDWYMGKFRAVSSMQAVEQRLHNCFDRREIDGTREIFDVPYTKAANYTDHLADAFKPRFPVPWKGRK